MLPDLELEKRKNKLNLEINWEEFLFKYRVQILLLLSGLILLGVGFLVAKGEIITSPEIEVLENASEAKKSSSPIVVEVVGGVEKPGVYKLAGGARVEDALIAAGGISVNADRDWMEKMLNRAAKLVDGQKIYIPRVGEVSEGQNNQSSVLSAKNSGGYQSVSSSQGSGLGQLVNINTASVEELDSLWGIGRITAQNIIEHRPYSSVEELLTKKIIKKNVYEKNKNRLTVY